MAEACIELVFGTCMRGHGQGWGHLKCVQICLPSFAS